MTLKEIATMINSFGLTWRKNYFSTTPSPPYVVYYFPSENDVHADNTNFVNRRQLFIELYIENTDTTSETAVETKLKANGISWYKTNDYLNDEKIHQITYESEVIVNG